MKEEHHHAKECGGASPSSLCEWWCFPFCAFGWCCFPAPLFVGGAFTASWFRVVVPFSSSSFGLVLLTLLFLWVVVLKILEKKPGEVNQMLLNSIT